jgi:hypothetical protein
MPLRTWFGKQLGSEARRAPRRRGRARLEVEGLECRVVPSTFTEMESNDSPATANTVTPGTGDVLTTTPSDWLTIDGAISASSPSPDYYRFTLSARSGVFFDIDSRDIGLSTNLDTVLTLFDSSGANQLATNDNGYDFEGFAVPATSTSSATSRDSSLYADLTPGTYLIRVIPVSGTGNYQLRILADSAYTSSPPVLNSRPGSADTYYLDFDGHAATDRWGTYTAAAFDFNGTATEFSPAERLTIKNLWNVVSEDFSPFNINISTVEPGSFANGVGFRQVITSSPPSIVNQATNVFGVAFLNSYAGGTNDNISFTFAANVEAFYTGFGGGLSGQIMATIVEAANTTSHEFGHALGLEHYSSSLGSAGSGTVIPGAIMATPEVGLNRETWAAGTNEPGGDQVDVDVISNAANTFGYVSDDFGGSTAAATNLTPSGNTYTTAGVIHTTTDADFFRFVGSGATTITVDVREYVNNLDAAVRLFNSAGTQIALADPSGGFDATITQTLPAGVYFISVSSNGEVGEVGQYSVQIDTSVQQPPVASDLNLTTNEDVTVGSTLPATDLNDDPLTYTILSGPSNGTLISFNPNTGAFVYRPNAEHSNTAATPDTFTFRVNDGSANSNTATVSIVVNVVNDTPIVTTSGGSTPFTENGSAVVIDANLGVTDVDSTNLTVATVQITGGYQSDRDTLMFTDTGSITGAFNATTGTLILTGTDTVANYRTALRSVTFVTTSDTPGTARTVTFTATDGNSFSTAVTRTIAVTAVNDAPVVTTATGSASFVENTLPIAVDGTLTLADPDNANLTGATVQITGGYASGQDALVFTPGSGITGSFNATTGTLTLTGTTSLANYQTALRTVFYANPSESPSTSDRTITYTVTDGSTPGAGATRTITVAAINDAPVNTVPSGPLVASEDTPRAITGISIADADAGTGTIVVTLAVTSGVLTVSTTAFGGLTAGQVSGNGTQSVTLTGTRAAINATLAAGTGALYRPDANTSGSDMLTVTTDDQGNAGGPARSDTDQIALAVREVNDAPGATADVLSAISADGGTVAISFADLIGNDTRGAGNESDQTLSLVSVLAVIGGTATISGETVLFTPDPNYSGTAGFTYLIRDDGTTASSSDPKIASATVTFTVTPRAASGSSKPKDQAFAFGLGAGLPAFAALFNADGSLRFVVNALPGFTGGVSAAAGDINGDGRADLLVGLVLGGYTVIEAFDGNTGNLMHAFFAFPAFGPVAMIGANDVNGDGFDDVFIGPVFGFPAFGVYSGRDQTYVGIGLPGGALLV